MGVSPRIINTLNELFCDLDESRQKKVLSYAYRMTVEQTTEKKLKEKGRTHISSQELDDETTAAIHDIGQFMKDFMSLDASGQAAIVMMMEKINPGAFNKEETVTVTTTSTSRNFRAVLKEAFPSADLAAAKESVDKVLGKKESYDSKF